jgi:hypothetical protein
MRRGRFARAPAAALLLAAGLALALAASAAPTASPGQSLGAVRDMAAAGAPGLALQRMDRTQPAVAELPSAWAEWERARIDILARAGAWQRALERLTDLPDAAPEPFRRWAPTRRAELHLELDEPDAALALLRERLWNAGPGAQAGELRHWRRLVARAHLVAGRVDDAVLAVRRFDQQEADASGRWAELRSRILLRAGLPGEALAGLPAATTPRLHALRLLAQLRSDGVPPSGVYQRARDAARQSRLAPAAVARFRFVAAEAAAATPALDRRVRATERAAARVAALPADDELFRIDGDALWAAWLASGRAQANERRLLIGDDAAWFDAADAVRPQNAARARSLLAVVALRGGAEARARAHGLLLALLAEPGPGLAVARQAYLHGARFAALRDVPQVVRYRLVDDALQRDDLDLAHRLLASLDRAPADVAAFAWRLLRARVQVRSGRVEAGVETLRALLADHPDVAGQRLDSYLQVVFELQEARAHAAALGLLQRLGRGELPGQRRRELFYWRAESQEALEAPARAAELYLRSATLLDGRGADPWGRTARYQAARMLAQAGLISDARRIYTQLLRTTGDRKRRATLRKRLQKLGLHAQTSPARPAAVP